jgi:hypothetical protein
MQVRACIVCTKKAKRSAELDRMIVYVLPAHARAFLHAHDYPQIIFVSLARMLKHRVCAQVIPPGGFGTQDYTGERNEKVIHQCYTPIPNPKLQTLNPRPKLQTLNSRPF